jgi:hypothetical protein
MLVLVNKQQQNLTSAGIHGGASTSSNERLAGFVGSKHL